VVIVCLALLKLNWKNELLKWLVHNYRIDILYGNNGKSQIDTYYCNANAETSGQITIINYDILKSHQNTLTAQKIDLLICDESQYVKSPKAQRTKAVAALAKVAARKVFLTGTPILNRPIDLFPTLQMFNHKLGDNYYRFITNWCNAYRDRFGMKIGYPTKEQAKKLQAILRESIMIRRMKSDVLKELPAKRRQLVALDIDSVLDAAIKKEKERMKEIRQAVKEARQTVKQAGNDEKAYKEAIQKLKEVRFGSLAEIAKLRHETALAKIPHTIQYIDMLLESVDKLVVFTYHKDVLNQIYQNYKDIAVTVSGDNTTQERQQAVERFQTDDNVRLFLGTIGAAGTGITLTAASHVLFAELDWTPANLAQAEDRVHRIGQQDSVSIYYLVVDRSIDSKLAKTHIRKLEGITRITDIQKPEPEEDLENILDDDEED
jgi:SWI/SNF-related matrix-associated actin-dependent regulator 1 of chromatin subfamily A